MNRFHISVPGIRRAVAAGLLLSVALAGCGTPPPSVIVTTSRGFGTSMPSYDAEGNLNPVVEIDLARHDFPVRRRLPLAGGAFLDLRSDLDGLDDGDFETLGTLVADCYASVEASTGRPVGKNTLIFLLSLDQSATSWVLRYELPPEELDLYCWTSVLPLAPDERITREPMSYIVWMNAAVTLAHELTHEVLRRTRLASDMTGEAVHLTRWFEDGTADWVAARFGAQCEPDLMRRYQDEIKGLPTLLDNAEIRERVFDWPAPGHILGTSEEPEPPRYEFELYGASYLLMSAWLRQVSLPELLDRVDASPVPVDRAGLFQLLQETTGLSPQALMDQARELARE